ncbi:MAG TPA: M23 family metallopeptidase [Desulfosporosinus sp.]|nr:M23 family metallopeptidase [Desulfosporosinus sp.]
MKCFRNVRKQRVRIVTGSVAFFIGLGISLVSVFPVYSQVVPGTKVICYSVVTLEAGVDLRDLATRYNTTVEEIQKRNSAAPLLPGTNLTIQENTIQENTIREKTIREKTIKRIQTVSRGSVMAWNWPMIGDISQAYGSKNGDFHHGLDIANASGSIVRAARAGKVTKTDWFGVYGITVMIDHGNGVQTLYAHNSKLLVKVGDAVSAGEEISLSGNTGNSTGPHLHFEIRHNGRTVDPEDYLPKTRIVRL